ILIYINKIYIISIINIITISNIVYIKKNNKKTIFFTYYSLYKYFIILFSLYNTLGIF
ncbi:hypothetical protein K491DRAFT_615514, partial [Lophiostoma macrostomum CBS 122681]